MPTIRVGPLSYGVPPVPLSPPQQPLQMLISRRESWLSIGCKAARVLGATLLNAAASAAFAWLSAACFSQGNVASGRPVREQSYETYLVGTLLWVHLFFCASVWVAQALPLVGLRLLAAPETPMTLGRCLWLLLRRSLLWFLVSGGVAAAIAVGCSRLAPRWRRYKLELYASAPWNYSYLTVVNAVARRVFRRESVEGASLPGKAQPRAHAQAEPLDQAPAQPRVTPARRHSWLLVSLVLTVAYIHMISFLPALQRQSHIAWLVLGSLALKIATQELARLYILRADVQSPRAMAALVCVPTVLIDTQVRIALLRQLKAAATVSGVASMALGELASRVFKAVVTAVQLHRGARSRSLDAAAFATWKRQVLFHHMTELSAEMHAEYIAIGCSYAVLVCFQHHPFYRLWSDAGDAASASFLSASQRVVTLQVLAQLVVDYLSCLLEVRNGMSFAFLARERRYLLVLFPSAAERSLGVKMLAIISRAATRRPVPSRLAAFSSASKRRAMSSKTSFDREGTIEITPEKPTATVVFVHGLGDTAHGWADAMQMLSKDLPHVKFVLPTAKSQPVTLNMGMRMPSWYDIKSLSKSDDDDADGIEASRDRLLGFIEKEVAAGIPHSRIVLGGFSQGGAMSLFTGFQMKVALAGVLCLSGYIPKMKAFAVTPETKQVPLLMCHGEIDPVVQFQWGKLSKEKIAASGVQQVEFRTYPDMEHSACMEELDDIKRWLTRVLPKDVCA
ncbi:hypothetical protein P43SY_008150 [Pythium insidiosum]|uniref:palmitoyl-protein hydrolase n=1 Tax=Pythium insidiosum TaxID=114742 RepID=A0AAD5LI88_PYTIN|nr:hypothetical protein P43SY_008150 [Pythium insidiosum]